MTEHIEDAEKWIERSYSHPDLSPWHVREAMREMLAEIKDLRKEVETLKDAARRNGEIS